MMSDQPTRDRLTRREQILASLLHDARVALWREWVEHGSIVAKDAYDRTDPKFIES